jgi:glycosyltransferase involved in cell wall biosynthesis
LLQRYGLRDSFILFLGAGDIRKNEAGLVAAYAALPPALRDRHQLVIVGRTDEAALHRTASRLELPPGGFVTVPFVDEGDLNALYSACGVFVFPSLHEGFGLPVAEAMACGAPVIASNNSSLPEVIGRADATFDALEPTSIAACLQRVLENPDFRAELAAYGPVQAGRFTWPSSAARAWDALEQIHARRIERDNPRPVGVLLPRPRLAFVSPLPPQASGIADYSRDLLPSLSRYYDITVVSEVETDDIRLYAAFPRLDPASFLRQARDFDRVVYQVGNSSFHRFQTEALLPHCPGVVVLHDAFLSDYMHWLAHDQGRPADFRVALWRAHGYGALMYYAERGPLAAMAQYPCSLPVLQASLGVIQHSRHGVDILRQHFGEAGAQSVTVLPHGRAVRARLGRDVARVVLGLGSDEFVVVSFGTVGVTKCPELLVEAWRGAGLAGRLVFAGGVEPDFLPLVSDARAGIFCTGRLSAEHYDAWLSAADLAVQWRRGSRGESSGAVADALMAGVPLIVNRHGSAAELPPKVALALPDDADASALAQAMLDLRHDAARRTALSAAARSYAVRELAPETIARRYRDAIEQAYATPLPAIVARGLAPEIEACFADATDLTSAARAIVSSFDDPWRTGGSPRLLIDMSELALSDSLSGIQHLVREIGRRALQATPHGRQCEGVRLHDGRLRYTHTVPLQLLGQAGLNLPETPLDARHGDVLLCAGPRAEMTAGTFAELRRLWLDGMRIALAIDDLSPLRPSTLSPDAGGSPARECYTRLLGIADVVACTSRVLADDLAAWLDDNRSLRRTSLPIGVFQTGTEPADTPAEQGMAPDETAAPAPGLDGLNSPSWDETYSQLCAILFEKRRVRIWQP